MRHVKSALIVVAVVCLPVVLGLRAVPPGLGPVAGEASAQTGSEREKLVGTYQLVGREVKDADGTWRPTQNFNSIGYITYSDTGYMGVHVMPNDRGTVRRRPADRGRGADGASGLHGLLRSIQH